MAGLLPMKAAKLQAPPPIQCAQHGLLISSRPVESATRLRPRMRPPVHLFDWQLHDHKAAIALANIMRQMGVERVSSDFR